jgi:hypothetical protein
MSASSRPENLPARRYRVLGRAPVPGIPSAQRPMLLLNPPDDADFAAQSDAVVAAGRTTPELLQAALRVDYPNAVVRERELAGELLTIWYVYREGHWIPPDSPR